MLAPGGLLPSAGGQCQRNLRLSAWLQLRNVPGMSPNPFRYFKTSPEIIRLAVMLYVRFPLSLRNVEDLLHERGGLEAVGPARDVPFDLERDAPAVAAAFVDHGVVPLAFPNEGLSRIFAYRRIVMNTLFGSSVYSPNGPQYTKPKLS